MGWTTDASACEPGPSDLAGTPHRAYGARMRHSALLSAVLIAAVLPLASDALLAVDRAFDSALGAVTDTGLTDSQKASVSNVLKTRHDTVKNSIGNIR